MFGDHPYQNLTTGLHEKCVVLIIHIWMNMINGNCGDEHWTLNLCTSFTKKLALAHLSWSRFKRLFLFGPTTFSVTFCFKELGYECTRYQSAYIVVTNSGTINRYNVMAFFNPHFGHVVVQPCNVRLKRTLMNKMYQNKWAVKNFDCWFHYQLA